VKILVVNPNTSRAMLGRMLDEARASCCEGTQVSGAAAAFGVPQISTRAELALAGHALLDAIARHQAGHDAIVIGAFYHEFVPAAKELASVPVVGIAEAAMRAAQMLGRRVAILGLGAGDRGLMEDLAAELAMESMVVATRALPRTGAALLEDPGSAHDALVELGLACVREDRADVLVLGGAAFAGMAPPLAARLPVPVVSPVHYAVGLAELIVLAGWARPSAGAYAPPGPKATSGLGPELAALFPPPPP